MSKAALMPLFRLRTWTVALTAPGDGATVVAYDAAALTGAVPGCGERFVLERIEVPSDDQPLVWVESETANAQADYDVGALPGFADYPLVPPKNGSLVLGRGPMTWRGFAVLGGPVAPRVIIAGLTGGGPGDPVTVVLTLSLCSSVPDLQRTFIA